MASKRLYRTHDIDTFLTNNYYVFDGVITHGDIISYNGLIYYLKMIPCLK
jgi:hypothetical protein